MYPQFIFRFFFTNIRFSDEYEDPIKMSDEYVNLEEKLSRCVRTQNELLRIWFAEFLGTFLLCLIGNGSVHQGMNKTEQDYWKQNPEHGPLMVLSWIMFPGSPDKNSSKRLHHWRFELCTVCIWFRSYVWHLFQHVNFWWSS